MKAMQSISTLTPLRGAAASTVVRAGCTPLKYSLNTRLNTGKSSMLRRKTPTLTTFSMEVPAASSTARTLSSVTRVCSARSGETTSLVTGSSGPCPETKRNWPHLTPWAMGDSTPSEKPVLGADFVYTTSGFMRTRLPLPGACCELDGEGLGPELPSRLVGLGDPGAHLEARGAVPLAHRHIVIDAKGLLPHLADAGPHRHRVTVAHGRGEARTRVDDGHAHHAIAREEHGPRHLQRVEQRLRSHVEPLEEARIEGDARRIGFRPPHPDVDPVHRARHRFASTSALRRKRWSLPVSVRGSSRTTRISRGR